MLLSKDYNDPLVTFHSVDENYEVPSDLFSPTGGDGTSGSLVLDASEAAPWTDLDATAYIEDKINMSEKEKKVHHKGPTTRHPDFQTQYQDLSDVAILEEEKKVSHHTVRYSQDDPPQLRTRSVQTPPIANFHKDVPSFLDRTCLSIRGHPPDTREGSRQRFEPPLPENQENQFDATDSDSSSQSTRSAYVFRGRGDGSKWGKPQDHSLENTRMSQSAKQNDITEDRWYERFTAQEEAEAAQNTAWLRAKANAEWEDYRLRANAARANAARDHSENKSSSRKVSRIKDWNWDMDEVDTAQPKPLFRTSKFLVATGPVGPSALKKKQKKEEPTREQGPARHRHRTSRARDPGNNIREETGPSDVKEDFSSDLEWERVLTRKGSLSYITAKDLRREKLENEAGSQTLFPPHEATYSRNTGPDETKWKSRQQGWKSIRRSGEYVTHVPESEDTTPSPQKLNSKTKPSLSRHATYVF
jgi:hypothetical protein